MPKPNNVGVTDFNFLSWKELNDGCQAVVKYLNGYGASIVKHRYSYGGPEGLYEIAVLDSEGSLCYDTSITSDVIGRLGSAEVTEILNKIAALPPAKAE